ATFLVYLIFTKWIKKIPSVIAAILIGLFIYITNYKHKVTFETGFVMPTVQSPEFSLVAFFTVSIPLALLILSNDAVPGIGALKANNYKVKTNEVIIGSGVTSIITSLFGGQSGNVAGVMSLINADKEAGDYKKRYVASVISGVIIILFGIF